MRANNHSLRARRWCVQLIWFALATVLPSLVQATLCTDVFPSGVQNHNDAGLVIFDKNAQLRRDPDKAIETFEIQKAASSTRHTCGRQDCGVLNRVSESLVKPGFRVNRSNRDLTLQAGARLTLGANGRTRYKRVRVVGNSLLRFSPNYEDYRIKRFVIRNATVKLRPGNYWIEELIVENGQIEVIGRGTARLFIKGAADFSQSSLVNSPAPQEVGPSQKLFLYGYGNIKLGSQSTFSAVVYSERQVSLGNRSHLYGSLAASRVRLRQNSRLFFTPNRVQSANLTPLCEQGGTNQSPVSDAGTDQSVALGSTVTLDGSGSTDADGDPLSYLWTLVGKPNGSRAQLSDPTGLMPTFVADVAGTYEISLTVNDGELDSLEDMVRVTTENSAPVANAGTDQSVLVSETVTLNGTLSSDVDGDPLSYHWEFVQRPSGSLATLSDRSSPMPTFIADLPGTYLLELVVNDGTIDSVPATVTITTQNSAPNAHAGSEQTVFVTDTVTLDGSGSGDVDGDLLTYHWSITDSPVGSAASLSDANAVMPSFIADKPGTYVAQLIVNDGSLDSVPDTVTITTLNSAPVAHAGADQSVFVTDAVTLNGSSSTDVDGDALTMNWALVSKPAGSQATLSDPTAVMPTFIVDLAGTYIAQLIVNDGQLDSVPDTITVTTLNSPPVAEAGTDQTVLVTETVTLDGSASNDADGDSLSYSWSITSRPVGSGATLSDATAVQPTFEVDVAGTYVAQLIVNDGTVDSAPNTVTITTANSQPIADAGADQSVFVTDTVTLDGSGSTDVDGDVLSFTWSLTAKPVDSTATLSDTTAVMPGFVADKPGTYVAQLIINDGTVDSVPDTVTITTLNSAPVADAGADQTAFVTDSVILNGNGSADVDGDALTYLWSFSSLPAGSNAILSDTSAITPNFTIDQPGTYVIQLVVYDGQLNSASDSVTITTENSRPVAYAGEDQSVPLNQPATLDGNGSTDVDGDPLSFSWALTVVPTDSAATLTDPSSAQPTFTPDKSGTYVAQLIVNDGTVNSDPDTVTILTVNSAPIANAGADQTVTVGNAATLDGTASTDENADPLSYQWTIVSTPAGSTAQIVGATTVNPIITPDEIGAYILQLVVNDGTVDSVPDLVTVTAEAFVPLAITLDSHVDGDQLNQAEQTLVGQLSKNADLTINGATVAVQADLSFSYVVSLAEGENLFDLQATHSNGETDELHLTLFLDSEPPSSADEELVYVTTSNNGQVTIIGDPHSAEAGTEVSVTNQRTGETSTVGSLPDGSFSFDFGAENGDTLSIVVADAAGNQSTTLNLVVGAGLPTLDPIGDKVALLGQTLTFNVTATAPDEEHIELGISPVPLPEYMKFDISTGEFTFTPRGHQSGDISLTFHARTRAGEVTETINLSVPAPDANAPTRYVGRVMDATTYVDEGLELPIVGARVTFLGTGEYATTDANGEFILTNLPAGEQVFDIDSTNANVAPGGAPYASFREKMHLIANVDNIIVRPFFLPRIDVSSSTTINPVQTNVVENSDLEVSLTIPPNTAFNLDGSQFVGELSISQVPESLAPIALPDVFDPSLLITIQPVGVTFVQPVPVTMGNIFPDLPPGAELEIWSVDPSTGLFRYAGEATISSDGDRIETVSGGITDTTWHFVQPTSPDVTPQAPKDDNGNTCPEKFSSSLDVSRGCLQTEIELPEYRSLESERGLKFVYKSRAANPHPIMPFDVLSATSGSDPEISLNVAGVSQGTIELNYGFSSDPRRAGVAFSAQDFESGIYNYQTMVSAFFSSRRWRCSSRRGCRWEFFFARLSTSTQDEVRIINEQKSPFGAGWLLEGQAKLFENNNQQVLIVFGDAQTATFRFDLDTNTYVSADGIYSTLEKLADNSYVFTDKHGMVTEFTSGGRQQATVDRNGNRTEYSYNVLGQLNTITDPLGKTTTLDYSPVTGKLISVTDPGGRVTQFEHNGVGDLTKVIFPDNSSKTFQYDHRHLMTAETDERGNTGTRIYNSLSRAVKATLPDGSERATSSGRYAGVLDFSDPTLGTELNPIREATPEDAQDLYVDANSNMEVTVTDRFGLETEITDAIHRVTTIERDQHGNPTLKIRPDGSQISMTYDEAGNLLSQTEEFNGATTTFTYDADFNLLSSITDARNHTFNIRRDTEGNPIEIENALGHITYVQYDSRGLVTQVTEPNGLVTNFVYNSDGLLESQTETPADTSLPRVTQMQYDSHGQLSQLQQPDGVILNFAYDDRGRLTLIGDNLTQQIAFDYDEYGNLTQTEMRNADASLARTLVNLWDKRNRLTEINTAGSVVQNLLDNNGNLTGIIDANGNQSKQLFDAVNRLVESQSPINGVTRFEYDSNDALTLVQAPNGVVTQYANDSLGRVIQETSGDRGTLNYSYDLANNVTAITDARGITAGFSYDELNRVTAVSYPNAAENVTYIYDSCAFGVGRLCGRIDESGATSFEYDGYGNLVTESHTELAVTYITRYQYDAGHNLIAMTLPSGRLVEYGRDGVRRINRVRTSVDGVVGDVVNGLGYRVDGQLIQRTWGNGLSESRDYDLQGRLLTQTLSGTDSRLYSYDANGNMLSQTATAENKEYAYDPLDRLISDATDGAEIDLSYDLNGNRLSRNAADGTLQETNDYLLSSNRIALSDLVAANPPTTTPPNERVFQYNNRGRLYQLYDEGQLVATYVYNAHGLRTRKVTDQGITLYHYDQFGQLISETEADGTLIRDYVWQDFEPIAQIESNATSERIVYLHTDHLNTPRLATDGSQSVQWRWQGEAYGLTAANEDVDGDSTLTTINLRFPGQYFDTETGLHYNYFRYYDPHSGRYITSDPIGLNGGLNTYLYVGANPLRWIDPLGLRWETIGTDYHGWKNWGMGIANRLANLEEGTIASPKNCVGCTRDVIQEWIPHPDDPQNNRNYCAPDDPMPGDRRKIEQQFGEFPDPWNVKGKSWHWEPPVPSPTYQNSFEGLYY